MKHRHEPCWWAEPTAELRDTPTGRAVGLILTVSVVALALGLLLLR